MDEWIFRKHCSEKLATCEGGSSWSLDDRTEKNEGNMLKNWLKCQRFKYSVLKLFNSRITKPVYSNDIFVFLFLRLQYHSWSRSAQSSSLLIPQYAEQENGG